MLLQALERLLRRGHSVVVIEHNLDVMRVADWIVDLGPEGAMPVVDMVCAGPPVQVMSHPGSHTGAELKRYLSTPVGGIPRRSSDRDARATAPAASPPAIQVINAREHNLKNIVGGYSP